jgi:hypothetical protein
MQAGIDCAEVITEISIHALESCMLHIYYLLARPPYIIDIHYYYYYSIVKDR